MKRIKSTVISLLLALVVAFIPSVTAKASEVEVQRDYTVVEVKDFSIEGGVLTPGSEISLNVTLHNTSSSSVAESVMITIKADKKLVYPVYGSDNQVFVGAIKAGEDASVSIPLTVSSTFSGDPVPVDFEIIYSSKGNTLSNATSIIIPSAGGNKIAIKSVDVATHAVVGGRSLISMRYSNQSNEDIADAKLYIEGNVSSDYREIEMDTIYSNKDYLDDYYVCFSADGNQDITISLAYKDAEGNQYNENLGTYTVSVSKTISEETTVSNGSKMNKYMGLGIMGLAGLITLILVFIYGKKHI